METHLCHSPKITWYVHKKRHIHPSFWTRCARNTKKILRAVRIRAFSFARERDIEPVCLLTLHDDPEIFVKARYCQKVGVDVLGAD
jgi:hypothetical protein